MNFATSFGLLLLGLFVLPVLVSGCLPDGRGGVPWYETRRDPTGLAPDPVTTEEAVIQVYAARAVSWRGVFSVHTWIAVKPTGAGRYTRYEVLGFGSPTEPRRYASTGWDPTITGSARDRGSSSSGADRRSTR
jgi:uncharacterized protein DUF3750